MNVSAVLRSTRAHPVSACHAAAKPDHGPMLDVAVPRIIQGNHTFLVYKGFEGLDKGKIKALLEASFGKKLAEDYFKGPVNLVIVEENYKGIAIVKHISSISYLDKLAVAPELQQNGVGKALWAVLKSQFPMLVWRSSATNPINTWYFQNSDGHQRIGEWTVFWCNLNTAIIHTVVMEVAALPATMIKPMEGAK